MADKGDIPDDLREAFGRCHDAVMAYLVWLRFTVLDTARDPSFASNHLLSYVSQDLIETMGTLLSCISDGIHNPMIREMRHLMEVSIKVAFVQQQNYDMSVEQKLVVFKTVLSDHKISHMREINLHYLKEETQSAFLEDVGRMYGHTSKYVHQAPEVILERIERVREGRTTGRENSDDLNKVTEIVKRCCAYSLVFLIHGTPQYVIGDFLVSHDQPLSDWYFLKSRYLAEIDATFDYKHERQASLNDLREARARNIEF